MISTVTSHIADNIHPLHLNIVCISVQLKKPAYPKNKSPYLYRNFEFTCTFILLFSVTSGSKIEYGAILFTQKLKETQLANLKILFISSFSVLKGKKISLPA